MSDETFDNGHGREMIVSTFEGRVYTTLRAGTLPREVSAVWSPEKALALADGIRARARAIIDAGPKRWRMRFHGEGAMTGEVVVEASTQDEAIALVKKAVGITTSTVPVK